MASWKALSVIGKRIQALVGCKFLRVKTFSGFDKYCFQDLKYFLKRGSAFSELVFH